MVQHNKRCTSGSGGYFYEPGRGVVVREISHMQIEVDTKQDEIQYSPVNSEKVNYYVKWKNSRQRRIRQWVSSRISLLYGGRVDFYKRKVLLRIMKLLAPKYGINDLTPNEKIVVGSIIFAKFILKYNEGKQVGAAHIFSSSQQQFSTHMQYRLLRVKAKSKA